MMLPARTNDGGVEPALGADQVRIEQVLGPWAQRPLDPLAHRHSKSCLRPVEKLPRDEPVDQLANDMLAAAVAQLEAERDSRRQLSNPMVEERDSGFEGHRHRGAVNFRE